MKLFFLPGTGTITPMVIEHPNPTASYPPTDSTAIEMFTSEHELHSSKENPSQFHPNAKINKNLEIRLPVMYDCMAPTQSISSSLNEIVIKVEIKEEGEKYSNDYKTFCRQFTNMVVTNAQILPTSALLMHCCPCCCSGSVSGSGDNLSHTLFFIENDRISGFAKRIYSMKVDVSISEQGSEVRLHILKSFPLKCSGRVSSLSIDSKVSSCVITSLTQLERIPYTYI